MRQHSDAILGGAAAVLGAAVYLETRSFPNMADGAPGPALFPQILAALLVLFGIVLVVQSERRHQSALSGYRWQAVVKACVVLISIGAYILLVQRLGFQLSAFLLLFGLMLMLGVRLRVALPASVFIVAFCVVLFQKVLRVPLPPGIMGF